MYVDSAKFFDELSATTAIVGSVVLLVLIASGDYLIGEELSLSALYLIPVMLITWKVSATAGVAIALFAYGLWTAVSLHAHGMTYAAAVLWDAALRLATAVLFVVLLSNLRASLVRESENARKDGLTGLANRNSFYELTEIELARCKRYGGTISIAFIDLDNFKDLNDRSGHNVGDEALRVVAQTLRGQSRSTDVAARVGGDEFAVMLAGMDARGANQATQILQSRLLTAMRERGWSISFSIGLATFEKVPASVDDMINRADGLMYQIKRAGKGGIREQVFA